jgi:hypothetical protein
MSRLCFLGGPDTSDTPDKTVATIGLTRTARSMFPLVRRTRPSCARYWLEQSTRIRMLPLSVLLGKLSQGLKHLVQQRAYTSLANHPTVPSTPSSSVA